MQHPVRSKIIREKNNPVFIRVLPWQKINSVFIRVLPWQKIKPVFIRVLPWQKIKPVFIRVLPWQKIKPVFIRVLPWQKTSPVSFRGYNSASEHSKVLPFVMSPVCSPSLNHFMRCLEVPWLNDSGTA